MKTLRKPERAYDTRDTQKHPEAKPMSAGEARLFPMIYDGLVTALAVNITVLPLSQDRGWLSAYAPGDARPASANVIWKNGNEVSNLANVPVVNGHIEIYTDKPCHLVLDIQGKEY